MIRPAIFVLLSLILITGCSKNNSSTSTSQGTLSATVGSTAFTAGSTYGIYVSAIPSMVAIGLIPQGKDTTFLQVSLPYPLPLNRPFSTDSTASGLSYYTASRTKSYDAYTSHGHALITISLFDTVNHKIAGTFNGTLLNNTTANDSVVITNGKFSTAYVAE